jgi:hypothetical protein
MKRIIILATALAMLVTSISGCWVGWDEGGRGGRDGGYDRDGEHDRDGGHDHNEGPRGHTGPGGSGGGH